MTAAVTPLRAASPSAGPLAPPQDLEAEQGVLGAILLSDAALTPLVADEGLEPAHFYRGAHARIFDAMLELHGAGEPVDVLTLRDQLRRGGALEEVGGAAALELLAGSVPAVGNVRRYAAIVRDCALRRAILHATYELQDQVHAGQGDAGELLEAFQATAFALGTGRERGRVTRLAAALEHELGRLEAVGRHDGQLTGLATGFTAFDEITGGLQAGNLIIVGARPSMGKSSWVTNVAVHVAERQRRPVLLFSLEMSEGEIAQRVLASETPMAGEKMLRGRLAHTDWPRLLKTANRLADAPLYLHDASDVTLTQIRARARQLAIHHEPDGGLALVIVDYLQLLRAERPAETRTQEIGSFSRGLKAIARELGCPVVALSQLNRNVEHRPDKKPSMADLRESGDIENDADLIGFLYREDYYDPDSPRAGEADLLIRKHRNGPTGLDIRLIFDKPHARFRNPAPDHLT
jgi:replicative DNA helicase